MRLRSLLFVPGDRPERMDKAIAAGADAVILDLEDSVAPDRKAAARDAVAARLGCSPRPLPFLVRINPLDSGLADDDLAALRDLRPDAIMLPKAAGAVSLRELDRRLSVLGDSGTLILPIATETPAALFQLGSYATEDAPRLCGLTWGAEDLSAAISAVSARDVDGLYTAPFQMVRALALFAAHAAGAPAIETVYPDIRDNDGLRRYAERGARDGFTGMMAIHPGQVAVINDAFTPSPAALAHARAVVAAFAADPMAGALQLDGKMIDRPHLIQAERLLRR